MCIMSGKLWGDHAAFEYGKYNFEMLQQACSTYSMKLKEIRNERRETKHQQQIALSYHLQINEQK